MSIVNIILDVDETPPLKGIPVSQCINIDDKAITFGRIPKGMASGSSSVGISVQLPDERYVVIQLSMANFEGVAAAFRGAEQRAKECDGRN